MGSVVSSENEGPPDDDCAVCGHWRVSHDRGGAHCRVCHTVNPVGSCEHVFAPAEPKGSEGSSLDELCHCGHPRRRHLEGYEGGGSCVQCVSAWAHAFAPAEGETAGCVVAHHVHTGGPGDVRLDTCRDDPEPETAGEPEAPECSACGGTEPDGSCPFCAHRAPEQAPPPPRPPYALTYVTGSGARIQIALPGEATTGVFNGALIITHPSGVLGIEEIKPYEEGA